LAAYQGGGSAAAVRSVARSRWQLLQYRAAIAWRVVAAPSSRGVTRLGGVWWLAVEAVVVGWAVPQQPSDERMSCPWLPSPSSLPSSPALQRLGKPAQQQCARQQSARTLLPQQAATAINGGSQQQPPLLPAALLIACLRAVLLAAQLQLGLLGPWRRRPSRARPGGLRPTGAGWQALGGRVLRAQHAALLLTQLAAGSSSTRRAPLSAWLPVLPAAAAAAAGIRPARPPRAPAPTIPAALSPSRLPSQPASRAPRGAACARKARRCGGLPAHYPSDPTRTPAPLAALR
jgi:hypothetical protein